MKQAAIKKILLCIILIINKEIAITPSSNDLLKNDHIENILKNINENQSIKDQSYIDKTIVLSKPIAFACIAYIIYNYCINKFEKEMNEEATENSSKKEIKNIFEKIQSKIEDSSFGAFFGGLYNELILTPDISSILNNSELIAAYKEEFKKDFFIKEQAQGIVFGEILGLLFNFKKTVKTLKKGFNNALNIAAPVLLLIGGSSFLNYKITEWTKKEIKDQLGKINYLSERPLLKDSLITSGCVIADHYIVTPVFGSLGIYLIQSIEECFSKSHKTIKKGRVVKLAKDLYTGNDSEKTKNLKNTHNAAKTTIKTTMSIFKIYQNILKMLK